jgi:MFS family permease
VDAYVRRIRHFQRGTLLLLYNTLGSYTGYGAILLVFNLYLVALGYHEDFIGLFNSVMAVAMIAGSFGAVEISRRWGHAGCIAIGSLGVVVSGVGLSFAESAPAILALGALNGFTQGQLFVPVGPYLVHHTTPDDRQDAFSVIWAAQSFSQALGSAIAGALPSIFAVAFALGSADGVMPLRLTLLAGSLTSAFGLLPLVAMIRLPAGLAAAPARLSACGATSGSSPPSRR